jgi:hypothetical protein
MVLRRRLALVPVVLMVTVGLVVQAGCGGSSKAATSVGAKWVSEAKNLSVATKDFSQLGDDALRVRSTTITTKIAEAPAKKQLRQMSPEVRQQVQAEVTRLRAVVAFTDQVTALLIGLDQRRLSIAAAAEAIADIAVQRGKQLTTEARAWLRENTTEILQDAGCELAWNAMTEDEHTRTNAVIEQGTLVPAYGPFLKELLGKVGTTLAGAVTSVGKAAFLKRYNDPEVVDWVLYGDDLAGKAADLTEDGATTLTGPTGTTYTRALFYFARVCLRAPS